MNFHQDMFNGVSVVIRRQLAHWTFLSNHAHVLFPAVTLIGE